jgi:hypothetical protein
VFAFDSGEPELLYSGEHAADTYHVPILDAINGSKATGVVLETVCERFVINAQTVKNSQAPYSLEQIGVLKYLLLSNGLNPELIRMQLPSNAKIMFDNASLKKLGYWHKGGAGHALDAIRHGLLHLTKNGWTPLRLLQ